MTCKKTEITRKKTEIGGKLNQNTEKIKTVVNGKDNRK